MPIESPSCVLVLLCVWICWVFVCHWELWMMIQRFLVAVVVVVVVVVVVFLLLLTIPTIPRLPLRLVPFVPYQSPPDRFGRPSRDVATTRQQPCGGGGWRLVVATWPRSDDRPRVRHPKRTNKDDDSQMMMMMMMIMNTTIRRPQRVHVVSPRSSTCHYHDWWPTTIRATALPNPSPPPNKFAKSANVPRPRPS